MDMEINIHNLITFRLADAESSIQMYTKQNRKTEQIFRTALEKNPRQPLAKQALELTEQYDKPGLRKLVRKYPGNFTKNILTGAAADFLLKFLLQIASCLI